MANRSLDYTPSKTCGDFMRSKALAKFLIGSVGSGKTTACIMHILQVAAQQRRAPDGLRYTRFSLTRNTMPQIKQTVLKDVQQLFGGVINYKVSEATIYIEQGDIRCEIIMIPLETLEDQRRLLSTQLTCAYINEFREVNYDLIPSILGRVGRYPSKMDGGPSYYGLFADSNPFSEGSDWHDHLVKEKPDTYEVFQQPGGLLEDFSPNPLAENVENLPDNYYQTLSEGQPMEWVRVHVFGLWGEDLTGQVVFKDSFSREWHVLGPEDDDMIPVPGYPLVVGLDFGRTPAAVVMQRDVYGRISVFDEITSEGMGLESFLAERLVPLMSTDRFAGKPFFIIGDPAGMAKSQLTEESAFDMLRRLGFSAAPAMTNKIEPRLRVVEKNLRDGRKGQPMLRIDPRCGFLIKALSYEYRYAKLKTGRMEETPTKGHPWSDIVDAFGYGLLGLDGNIVAREIARKTARPRKPAPTAAAWT